MLVFSRSQSFGLGAVPGEASAVTLRALVDTVAAAPPTEFLRPGDEANTLIHVPEREDEPFGKFAIELGEDDLLAYQTARNDVINAIAAVGELSDSQVKRLLTNADAFPALDLTLERADRFVQQAGNLLDVYQAEVVLKQPVLDRGPSGLAIAGGIFLGLAALGGLVYASGMMPKRKASRRRGRR